MKITKLRQERIKRNWKLKDVAEKMNLSKTAIHDIETLKQKPSYDVLIKLCKLFNVETNDIQQLFTVVDDTPISRQNDTTETQ